MLFKGSQGAAELDFIVDKAKMIRESEHGIIESKKDYLLRQKERFLSRSRRPRRWINGKGQIVEMTNARNEAAQICWSRYRILKDGLKGDFGVDARIQTLQGVR